MSTYVKLINNLEKLKLISFKDNLDTILDQINRKEINYIESLLQLTTNELKVRNEKAKFACVRTANFPI
jgi:hypothetical protein